MFVNPGINNMSDYEINYETIPLHLWFLIRFIKENIRYNNTSTQIRLMSILKKKTFDGNVFDKLNILCINERLSAQIAEYNLLELTFYKLRLNYKTSQNFQFC